MLETEKITESTPLERSTLDNGTECYTLGDWVVRRKPRGVHAVVPSWAKWVATNGQTHQYYPFHTLAASRYWIAVYERLNS